MSHRSKRRKPITTYRSRCPGAPVRKSPQEEAEPESEQTTGPASVSPSPVTEPAGTGGSSQASSEAQALASGEDDTSEQRSSQAEAEASPSSALEAQKTEKVHHPGKALLAFLHRKAGKACIGVAALLVVAALCVGGWRLWYWMQPKFQDYTVELGADSVSLSDFLTPRAKADKVHFVSDVSSVNIDELGDIPLVLAQGKKEETVTLHVVDTTAPEVEFVPELVKPLSYEPNPEDFVVRAEDCSGLTFSFSPDFHTPEEYGDYTVTVVVTDEGGNETSAECLLSYTWLKDSVTLELGDRLTREDVLLDPNLGGDLVRQADLTRISYSEPGEYTLSGTSGNQSALCTVSVVDTTPPDLVVQDVVRHLEDEDLTAELEDFLVSASDVSGDVEVRMLTLLTYDTAGGQSVTIQATDKNGNVTTQEAVYWLKADDDPPEISALSDLTLDKHSNPPDYLEGITATDSYDGDCEITVDDSAVDYDAAGTYYVTYTASDVSGNVASAKRKVTINHDSGDTDALVASIAQSIGSSDPKDLQEYVRGNVSYSTYAGGDDPVWYGFNNWTGNCLVHAYCLAALYDYYGIENYVIWTTDQSHYWNIVMTSDGLRHIDSTPASKHPERYMTDEDRLENLQGRDWDHSKWPACN